ncbi:MAG: hypothetical protein U5R31_07670 [Acidimicrobiia bacterium]|nr:hypothetical protein [Acidimicrobiia bacterium]
MLAAQVAVSAWDLSRILADGLTEGGEVWLWHSLRWTAVYGALTAATYVAIRTSDRGPASRRAAWLLAGFTAIVFGLGIIT